MSTEDRVQLFDVWATHYDSSIQLTHDFPFDGYQDVLDEIYKLSTVKTQMLVLDLGVGTGNLAKQFTAFGCAVWGIDFSFEMLAKAREKIPQARFVQADLLGDWPTELHQRFDRIVSSYVLHEFDLAKKVSLLQRLTHRYLANGGRIIIGDIAFQTIQTRELTRKKWANLWDEDEHYWAADETMTVCKRAGISLQYSQISSCGGIFVIESPYSECEAA